jgi:hypothetical protein
MTHDDVQGWLDRYIAAWTTNYNIWTLRFDADGRCAEFVEYYMELPEKLRSGR